MYCVTDDPLELSNLIGNPDYADEQATLANLLLEQSAKQAPASGQRQCSGAAATGE